MGLALVVGILRPASAHAQSRGGIEVALTVANGPTNLEGANVYYRDRRQSALLLHAAWRFAARGRVQPLVALEVSSDGRMGERADCPAAPDGGCRTSFPGMDGVGVIGGIRTTIVPRLDVTTFVGGGRFGGSQGSAPVTVRAIAEGDVGVHLVKHVVLGAGGRVMVWHEPGLGTHWFSPLLLSLGARF